MLKHSKGSFKNNRSPNFTTFLKTDTRYLVPIKE